MTNDDSLRHQNHTSPDALVRIASCWDVPRADLLRMVLAEAGIATSFGNANFLSWFWQCGNAVGGVTIHVRLSDAGRAREALAAAQAKPAVSFPSWTCAHCGLKIPGQWNACWQCGRLVDGTPGIPVLDNALQQSRDTIEPRAWQHPATLLGTAIAVLLVSLLLKRGLTLPLMVGVAILVYLLRQFALTPDGESQMPETAEPCSETSQDPSRTRSAVSRALVQRAWQAAVFAAFGFPPLGFYSLRLLWKLGGRSTPLSRADSLRTWLAFFISIWAIFLCLIFVGAVLAAVFTLFR